MKMIAISIGLLSAAVPSLATAQPASGEQPYSTFSLSASQFQLATRTMPPSSLREWQRPVVIEARRSALSLRLPTIKWESKKPVQFGSFWQGQSAAMKWETTFLALSAVDAAQTIHCLKRDLCEEANPIFGKHPSPGTIVASKLAGGLLHYALIKELNKRDPRMALRTAQISAALQGGVVAMNARIAF
jgi:hypothetical protein